MAVQVVCIGAGVANSCAAKLLAKKAGIAVTVITPHDYVEWAPGGLRSLVRPNETSMSLYPINAVFPSNVNIVKGFANHVMKGNISVGDLEGASDLRNVPYDILLIATGGKYDASSTSFLKNPANAATQLSRIAQFEAKARDLSAARNILIVGTGATGTELAAEIKHAYPEKSVTLAGRGGSVLPGFSAKSQKGAASHLAKVGIAIELNTSVDAAKEAGYDLVYHCTGFTPSTGFLKNGALTEALDDKGFLKIGPDGRVFGQSHVFAFGDIVTPGHMESPFLSGYVASLLAPKIVENVIRVAAGNSTKPLGKPAMKTGGMISLGPANGVANFDGFQLPSCMVVMMKSKDVFRKKYKGILAKK